MLDYVQRVQRAAADTARRSALKAAAGTVFAVALGFLVAALWSWLAVELQWGATNASLAIGGGFALIAVVMLVISSRPRHEMPPTDDLWREVEARVSLAAGAASDRIQSEAARMASMAEHKVNSVMDQAGFRANRLANDAERRAQSFVRDTAQTVGLTTGNIAAARNRADAAADRVSTAANSNAGSMAKLFGAFAVGLTIAAKLKESRDSRVDPYDDVYRDDDDYYY